MHFIYHPPNERKKKEKLTWPSPLSLTKPEFVGWLVGQQAAAAAAATEEPHKMHRFYLENVAATPSIARCCWGWLAGDSQQNPPPAEGGSSSWVCGAGQSVFLMATTQPQRKAFLAVTWLIRVLVGKLECVFWFLSLQLFLIFFF